MDCIFCQIAAHQIDSEIVYEDDLMMAFKDISPRAPVHIVAIPKKHIESINHIAEEDMETISHLMTKIKDIAKEQGTDSGYQVIANVGDFAIVKHLHFHIMGGGHRYADV